MSLENVEVVREAVEPGVLAGTEGRGAEIDRLTRRSIPRRSCPFEWAGYRAGDGA